MSSGGDATDHQQDTTAPQENDNVSLTGERQQSACPPAVEKSAEFNSHQATYFSAVRHSTWVKKKKGFTLQDDTQIHKASLSPLSPVVHHLIQSYECVVTYFPGIMVQLHYVGRGGTVG